MTRAGVCRRYGEELDAYHHLHAARAELPRRLDRVEPGRLSVADEGRSTEDVGARSRRDNQGRRFVVVGMRVRWTIAFLIGLATVTAAGFGWRAAQIGSTAAFDDRQAIAETVGVEQARVERAVAIATQTREYVRYRADYAVAAALDRKGLRREASALREGATRRAAAAGVFGRFTIGADLVRPTAAPRPFDYGARARALAAEQSAALDSPGNLEPDRWARHASDIRVRVNGLVRWAFVVLSAVLLYTVAEVSSRPRVVYGFAGAGLALYLAGLVGGLSTVFF